MQTPKTNDKILEIARSILASDGLNAVSFDEIARRLGKSKQAVLYWFPTKRDLLAAMLQPWLEAEADVAVGSVAHTHQRDEAIVAFVRALAAFHLSDLNRFRMMYLLPQTIAPGSQGARDTRPFERIYPVTGKIYGALAAHLGGDERSARREAVAIHAAVLGLVVMFGLAAGLKDPLKHTENELVEALAAQLSGASKPASE